MGTFIGGSAPAMAAQIDGGFVLVSPATLRGLLPAELGLLRQELDKLLREARGGVPPQDDALAQQARHRRIARLNSALQVVSAQMTRR